MSELVAAALGFAWGAWFVWGLHAKARRPTADVERLKAEVEELNGINFRLAQQLYSKAEARTPRPPRTP